MLKAISSLVKKVLNLLLGGWNQLSIQRFDVWLTQSNGEHFFIQQALTIQAVLGHRKAKNNGRGGDVRRSLNAMPVESSTRPKVERLSLLDLLGIPFL